MRIERGAIYKIGQKTFGVIEVDIDQTRVKLVELNPRTPEGRVDITMTGPALVELLTKQKVDEEYQTAR